MTQEADPKLAKLRLAYESAVQHEHAEAIAALDRGGRPVAPARCRELTESAWRELSAYIAGRERERWAPLLREAQAELDSHHRDGCSEVEAWNPRNQICSCGMEAWRTAVSALLQPEQEVEAQ